MALFIKDPAVDALAQELATLKRTTKTEAVHQALRNEIDREKGQRDLVALSLDLAHRLRERAGPNPRPAEAALRDHLLGNR